VRGPHLYPLWYAAGAEPAKRTSQYAGKRLRQEGQAMRGDRPIYCADRTTWNVYPGETDMGQVTKFELIQRRLLAMFPP
jgi:hypothetical protein